MITKCIDNPHLPTVFKHILRLRMDADYPYTQPLAVMVGRPNRQR